MKNAAVKSPKHQEYDIIVNIIVNYIRTNGIDLRGFKKVDEFTDFVSKKLKDRNAGSFIVNDNHNNSVINKEEYRFKVEIDILNKILFKHFVPFKYTITNNQGVDEFIAEFREQLLLANDERNKKDFHDMIDDYLKYYHLDLCDPEIMMVFNDWFNRSVKEMKLLVVIAT